MASRYLSNCTAILTTTLGSWVGCDIPSEARSDDNPALEDIYIEEIVTNGKGCPKDDPDSVQTVLSADKKSFDIVYRDMKLSNPPGPAIKNLSCQTAVKLHVPAGYQIAVGTVHIRGYLYLDENIRAKETSSYFFAGTPLGAFPHTTIAGPFDDFYEFTDSIPFESLVWSPCGSSALLGLAVTLNLNAEDNPDGMALFNVTDNFQSALDWQIRAC